MGWRTKATVTGRGLPRFFCASRFLRRPSSATPARALRRRPRLCPATSPSSTSSASGARLAGEPSPAGDERPVLAGQPTELPNSTRLRPVGGARRGGAGAGASPPRYPGLPTCTDACRSAVTRPTKLRRSSPAPTSSSKSRTSRMARIASSDTNVRRRGGPARGRPSRAASIAPAATAGRDGRVASTAVTCPPCYQPRST